MTTAQMETLTPDLRRLSNKIVMSRILVHNLKIYDGQRSPAEQAEVAEELRAVYADIHVRCVNIERAARALGNPHLDAFTACVNNFIN